jgi:cyclophilin family peptidyl-prolyl cis-trans isomerase
MENTNNSQQIITIADLDVIKQIIDLASTRGAFKGPELAQIGEVYNKLTTFLDLAAAQAQQEQSPDTQDQQTPADNNSTQGE